jgi:SAM-dependent methyltransferase
MLRRLEDSGLKIVHCDLKASSGVDEPGDVLDPIYQERLRSFNADLLLCSNLLEHLTEPAAFAAACGSLVKEGGYGLFTVPRSYPYHPDPIDTMFRPRPREIAAMVHGFKIVAEAEIKAGKFKLGPVALAKYLARAVMPFYRRHAWWPLTHRLLWLVRPYVQSLVLLRKEARSD